MLPIAVLALALALVSAVHGAPATGTDGLAKRAFASLANGDCYSSCPTLPVSSTLQYGTLDYWASSTRYICMFNVPEVAGGIVECDYHPDTGVLIGGPYLSQGASWTYSCPATAAQKGNCASTTSPAKRRWARELSLLEQKIKARQFNPRTKRAEGVAKSSRP